MRVDSIALLALFACIAQVITLVISPAIASGQTLKTLIKFSGSNVSQPYGGVIMDAAGNLYGTTYSGGTSGRGAVYRLNAANNYVLTRLLNFNGTNGANPQGTLVFDPAGNIFGSAYAGGSDDDGTLFKLNAATNFSASTLVNFNFTNGAAPYGTLMSDAAGNIYGATVTGGALGQGTVYRLNKASNYSLTTLANFGQSSGIIPTAGVVMDSAGNLYGTTQQTYPNGIGTVYKLDASNNYAKSTLVTFNSANGASAESELIIDKSGNLYGITSESGPGHYGTVFKLDASDGYALTTIAAFDGTNGAQPFGGLIADAAGNLFGTTVGDGGSNPIGTIFRLDAANNYAISTLATFTGPNGRDPFARLIADAQGNLFGTTLYGGVNDNGTVFELTGGGFVVAPEPSSLCITVMALGSIVIRRRP